MNHQSVDKWTHSARSSIILQRVYGMPFHRLSKLQSLYNAPIAESTLWIQCLGVWEDCGYAIYQQLLAAAGESKIFYSDDTGAKILEVMKTNKTLPEKQQRSCNTTTICTRTARGENIIIYMTDNKHCGENFVPIMTNRGNKDHYLKLMVDASSKNTPKVDKQELGKLIIINCLFHGREKFAEIKDYYPEECKYFLDKISSIYKIDHECRNYDSRKRLRHHKKNSSKHIKNIYDKYNGTQKLDCENSKMRYNFITKK